jgi:hypothetical protein
MKKAMGDVNEWRYRALQLHLHGWEFVAFDESLDRNRDGLL